MTDWANEKARELHGGGEFSSQAHLDFTAYALRAAYRQGQKDAERIMVERRKVSVHGTDGCSRCETGRITLYAGSRLCFGCQLAAALEREGNDK